LRKTKAADAEYMREYRARQKGPETVGALLNAQQPQTLRATWKKGVSQLKTPIYVKFDGKEFKGEFPGAVPHAMHILSGGQHLKALNRQTLQGWTYQLLWLAFLGNSKSLRLMRAKGLIPDHLMPSEGEHTLEEARELDKLLRRQKTDKKQEAWGSFEGTKEDVTEYCDSTPSQDAYLSWLELRARDFVYGCQVKTDDNDDD
jgi:hypothetical protein